MPAPGEDKRANPLPPGVVKFGRHTITEAGYYSLTQLRPGGHGGASYNGAIPVLALAEELRNSEGAMIYSPIDSTHIVRAESMLAMRDRETPGPGYRYGSRSGGSYAWKNGDTGEEED